MVVNKMDLLPDGTDGLASPPIPSQELHASVLISAAKGWNLDLLLQEIEIQLMDIDRPLMNIGATGA